MDHIIIRYGEISLKGNNRGDFENVLVRNIERALSRWSGVTVRRIGGRILISVEEATSDILAALQRVFGVLSLSHALQVPSDIDAMTHASLTCLDKTVVPDHETPTFKMEVKRADKRFPMKSPEIAEELGYRLLQAKPLWRVNVHNPLVTVYVEVRDEGTFVYSEKLPAVGGMPVGTSGRVGLLLSGGIDSPVAGWLAMKRGAEVDGIHFHSFPFTSERALQKVQDLTQILADWGERVRLHVVHFTEIQTEIRKHCPEPLYITIMRRMMMRIATEIASQRKLLALVTGESLGQVASQTLESMNVINQVTTLPILRPLVAEDKIDIIQRATRIGTYETSILPYEDCCTVFTPKNPRTKPQLPEVLKAESGLDIDLLVQRAVESVRTETYTARRV